MHGYPVAGTQQQQQQQQQYMQQQQQYLQQQHYLQQQQQQQQYGGYARPGTQQQQGQYSYGAAGPYGSAQGPVHHGAYGPPATQGQTQPGLYNPAGAYPAPMRAYPTPGVPQQYAMAPQQGYPVPQQTFQQQPNYYMRSGPPPSSSSSVSSSSHPPPPPSSLSPPSSQAPSLQPPTTLSQTPPSSLSNHSASGSTASQQQQQRQKSRTPSVASMFEQRPPPPPPPPPAPASAAATAKSKSKTKPASASQPQLQQRKHSQHLTNEDDDDTSIKSSSSAKSFSGFMSGFKRRVFGIKENHQKKDSARSAESKENPAAAAAPKTTDLDIAPVVEENRDPASIAVQPTSLPPATATPKPSNFANAPIQNRDALLRIQQQQQQGYVRGIYPSNVPSAAPIPTQPQLYPATPPMGFVPTKPYGPPPPSQNTNTNRPPPIDFSKPPPQRRPSAPVVGLNPQPILLERRTSQPSLHSPSPQSPPATSQGYTNPLSTTMEATEEAGQLSSFSAGASISPTSSSEAPPPHYDAAYTPSVGVVQKLQDSQRKVTPRYSFDVGKESLQVKTNHPAALARSQLDVVEAPNNSGGDGYRATDEWEDVSQSASTPVTVVATPPLPASATYASAAAPTYLQQQGMETEDFLESTDVLKPLLSSSPSSRSSFSNSRPAPSRHVSLSRAHTAGRYTKMSEPSDTAPSFHLSLLNRTHSGASSHSSGGGGGGGGGFTTKSLDRSMGRHHSKSKPVVAFPTTTTTTATPGLHRAVTLTRTNPNGGLVVTATPAFIQTVMHEDVKLTHRNTGHLFWMDNEAEKAGGGDVHPAKLLAEAEKVKNVDELSDFGSLLRKRSLMVKQQQQQEGVVVGSPTGGTGAPASVEDMFVTSAEVANSVSLSRSSLSRTRSFKKSHVVITAGEEGEKGKEGEGGDAVVDVKESVGEEAVGGGGGRKSKTPSRQSSLKLREVQFDDVEAGDVVAAAAGVDADAVAKGLVEGSVVSSGSGGSVKSPSPKVSAASPDLAFATGRLSPLYMQSEFDPIAAAYDPVAFYKQQQQTEVEGVGMPVVVRQELTPEGSDVEGEVKRKVSLRREEEVGGEVGEVRGEEEVVVGLERTPSVIDSDANFAYPDQNDSQFNGFPRFPLNVEKAIYQLSHHKLAQPRRPLIQQVMVSNLMLYILSVHADVTVQRQGPRKKKGKKKGSGKKKKSRRSSVGGAGGIANEDLILEELNMAVGVASSSSSVAGSGAPLLYDKLMASSPPTSPTTPLIVLPRPSHSQDELDYSTPPLSAKEKKRMSNISIVDGVSMDERRRQRRNSGDSDTSSVSSVGSDSSWTSVVPEVEGGGVGVVAPKKVAAVVAPKKERSAINSMFSGLSRIMGRSIGGGRKRRGEEDDDDMPLAMLNGGK
ncbi:hypothetical protein HDU98_002416 [Podochytrium sp. JEL0797]|nr:hypothetical protein HDU98_002416 [Podochytrium sp. JEL0797]